MHNAILVRLLYGPTFEMTLSCIVTLYFVNFVIVSLRNEILKEIGSFLVRVSR